MKKHTIFLLSFGLVFITKMNAQNFEPSYIENAYTLDTQSGATARYKALGGAMTALGGDMSAAADNPAGLAVFNTSEMSFSFGVNTTNNEVPGYIDAQGTRLGAKESATKLLFNQIGGVLVFETPELDWKSFALGINSQNIGQANEALSVGRDTGIKLLDPNSTFNGYSSYINGSNYRTNLTFAGNHQNNFYIGGSLDFYNSNKEIQNIFSKEVKDINGKYFDEYQRADSPLTENGTGFGLSLGLIYKPIQEVRLGLSYKSPVWWSMNTNAPVYEEFFYVDAGNTFYYRELDSYNSFDYDLTTPATVNFGAAYVFAKKGLLSVDYSLKDYRGIRLRTASNFPIENQLINNAFQSSSSVKIGAEYRVNDTFTLRGGYRFEQSPINRNKLETYKLTYDTSTGYGMNYYGDTKGFSAGLGLKFNKAWYLDLAYTNISRDKDLFIYGTHYDLNRDVLNGQEIIADFTPSGEGTVTIQNIKEVNHNISFTLGFRF